MKKGCLVVAAIVVSIFVAFCTSALWPGATLTFHLISDEGQPVSDAEVTISTFGRWQAGEGFGRDISRLVSHRSDSAGLAKLSSKSRDGHFYYSVTKDGYYPETGAQYQFEQSRFGRWQPDSPTVPVEMKRIVNPIAMYARSFRGVLPTKDQPAGFDLVAGDWVAPAGKGRVADFVVYPLAYADPKHPQAPTPLVTFSNAGDGIQAFAGAPYAGSQLRSPRYAPANGYQPKLLQKGVAENREDQNYFFRVRTILDGKGQVQSALYGKIYGEVLIDGDLAVQFSYCLNSASNDRNMEFDPKKNLFGELPSLEAVRNP